MEGIKRKNEIYSEFNHPIENEQKLGLGLQNLDFADKTQDHDLLGDQNSGLSKNLSEEESSELVFDIEMDERKSEIERGFEKDGNFKEEIEGESESDQDGLGGFKDSGGENEVKTEERKSDKGSVGDGNEGNYEGVKEGGGDKEGNECCENENRVGDQDLEGLVNEEREIDESGKFIAVEGNGGDLKEMKEGGKVKVGNRWSEIENEGGDRDLEGSKDEAENEERNPEKRSVVEGTGGDFKELKEGDNDEEGIKWSEIEEAEYHYNLVVKNKWVDKGKKVVEDYDDGWVENWDDGAGKTEGDDEKQYLDKYEDESNINEQYGEVPYWYGNAEGNSVQGKGKERYDEEAHCFGNAERDSVGLNGENFGTYLYPLRPNAEDCSFFMRTGTCKFGSNCKFNHPLKMKNQAARDTFKPKEEVHDSPEQTECKDTSSLALVASTYGDADFETDEDFAKSHVFCLEHAFEVEQKLCVVGGGHVLLLCHPDYPKFQAEAKVVADDLGAAHLLNNIDFKTATTEDRESFIYALNSEGLTHGYADWTVTLGVNLFHSAELGRSTNYSKQIPDNSVLYKAFGHGPSADISAKTKLVQKRSVVAGKWCGKVWMSDQIHDLLAEGVHDEQDLSQTLAKQQVPEPEVMPENPKKRQTVDFSSKSSRSALKRKRMADSASTSRIEYPEIVESVKDAPRGKCDIQYQRRHKLKKKVTQEKSLQPEKDLDQGRKQFNVNMEEKLEEGGPSTRLRPRTGKQPTKDPKLVMDKAIGRSATEKRTCSERAKSTRETQASTVRRTKKSDEPEYACITEGCSMTFGSKRELVLHNKNICSVEGCRKKFVSHKYLLQHKRVHLDDRPLKCSWVGCSKTFKWAWALTEHVRVHTGERPYACGKTGCGKKFRFVSDFSRHKRITGHSGETSRQRKARS